MAVTYIIEVLGDGKVNVQGYSGCVMRDIEKAINLSEGLICCLKKIKAENAIKMIMNPYFVGTSRKQVSLSCDYLNDVDMI